MDKLELIRKEIERLKSQLVRGACAAQISMETSCKEEAYDAVLSFIDSLEDGSELNTNLTRTPHEETKVKVCPRCGTVMKLQEDRVYTSLPPMYGYTCPKCGAVEYDRERIENAPDEPKKGYDPDYLQSCIDKAKESWKGGDVDEFMDDVRGREPVRDCHGLAEEIDAVSKRYPEVSFAKLSRIAKHFVEWAEHRKSEIPTNLEKAAEEYGKRQGVELKPFATRFFKAGAEWQKQQDFKDLLKSDNTNLVKCYEKGKEDQKAEDEQQCQGCFDRDEVFWKGMQHAKEEWMKEAVEGILVDMIDGTQEICLHDNRYGQKVKLIILKDDESRDS